MSLKRQTVWSILPLVTVTVVNIGSVPLFYGYLGPEMYAMWFYIITFTGAFGFMDLGIGVAVGRYMGVALGRGDHDAVREYWGTGNSIVIPLLALMGVAFTIVGAWFGPNWFNISKENVGLLRWSFLASGVGLFLTYYSQYWLILSQAYLDFRFLSIMRTAVSLVQIIPSIPIARATGNPLLVIVWGIIISAIQLVIYIWHARVAHGVGFSFRHAKWCRAREMAGYTSKIFASIVVNSLSSSIDRLILGRIGSPAEFSHYAISTNVGSRIQALSTAVMGPVFNQTNRAVGSGDGASPATVYNETFSFTFPCYLLASLWVAVWHPILLQLWLGPELGNEVSPVLVPVIAAYCLSAVATISSAQLGSLNRVGAALFFNIASACILVPGVYFGWGWGGVVGVAWAFLLSRVAFVAQDLFVIRLIRAGGWLTMTTWIHIGSQLALALALSATSDFWPRESSWQVIPAVLHALIVLTWLLRKAILKGLLRVTSGFAGRSA